VSGGNLGFGKVDREERGDRGDGGLVPQGNGFGTVHGRGRERTAELVNEVPVGVAGELGSEGLDGSGTGVAATLYTLALLSSSVILIGGLEPGR